MGDEFFQYFQNKDRYSNFTPTTCNNTVGQNFKLWELAGKAHPNIHDAVTQFQLEQAATEANLFRTQIDGSLPNETHFRSDGIALRD